MISLHRPTVLINSMQIRYLYDFLILQIGVFVLIPGCLLILNYSHFMNHYLQHRELCKYHWCRAGNGAKRCVFALLLHLCPTLFDLMDCRLLCPWDSPGKNTGVGCHALLQEIVPTQGLNPGLPHGRWILYCLNHQGSPLRSLTPSTVTALPPLHWMPPRFIASFPTRRGAFLCIRPKSGSLIPTQRLRD